MAIFTYETTELWETIFRMSGHILLKMLTIILVTWLNSISNTRIFMCRSDKGNKTRVTIQIRELSRVL